MKRGGIPANFEDLGVTSSTLTTTWEALDLLARDCMILIEVSCSKCEWKAAFSRTELLAVYGAQYPLPTLLDHLANNNQPDHSVLGRMVRRSTGYADQAADRGTVDDRAASLLAPCCNADPLIISWPRQIISGGVWCATKPTSGRKLWA